MIKNAQYSSQCREGILKYLKEKKKRHTDFSIIDIGGSVTG